MHIPDSLTVPRLLPAQKWGADPIGATLATDDADTIRSANALMNSPSSCEDFIIPTRLFLTKRDH
jgi:hypothetical protein